MKKIQSSLVSFSSIEWIFLGLGSILIAIWPMRDTIAVRNILLVLCTLISFFYLYKNFRALVWNQKQSIKSWMPIILVTLLFIWVLIHYFLFSRDPEAQLKELTSTWVRSLMAGITGFTLGLIINRREKGYGFIMLALISGLLIYITHYFLLVMQTGNVLQTMHWNSIYWGKINQVLIGTLFIAGILGFLDVYLRSKSDKSHNPSFKMLIWMQGLFYFLGLLVVLHCYVYAVNTRNGVGITIMMVLLFLLKILILVIPRALKSNDKVFVYRSLLIIFSILLALVVFSSQHLKNNVGWSTYLEDVKIASQVDKNSNWQTIPSKAINTQSGRQIAQNTYERTAWIIIASRTIMNYPWGYGLIHNAFHHLVKLDYPNSDLTVSHNGWLDLGLSFGVVGLTLALGSLAWTFSLSVRSNSSVAPTVFWSALGILLAYTLLEIFYYHGVEILIFWLVFMPALLLPKMEKK